MKKRGLIFTFTVFILAQLLLGFFLLRRAQIQPVNTVDVNALVQSLSQNYRELLDGNLSTDEPWNMDFSVINSGGKLIYSTRPGLAASINRAVAAGNIILDLEYRGQTVGKVLIESGLVNGHEAGNRQIILLLLITVAAEILLLCIYLFYLEKKIIKPFGKLQEFARRVAGGDLEYPLEMDRENLFGAFTESFDLMREELGKARRKQMEAEKSKKELVAKLSHDIKTPVASILAVAELMELRITEEKDICRLKVIEEKAQQIDQLISDLFHAALEELQELTVSPTEQESTILPVLLAAADYRRLAKAEAVPQCVISLDKQRLSQVFDNIFVNSYKYSGSEINVSFNIEWPYLNISIRDFGPGVDPQELPTIFEKFHRGKNAQGKPGAGLGLYISRYLMEQMGGKIHCSNSENGFTATISLKLSGF